MAVRRQHKGKLATEGQYSAYLKGKGLADSSIRHYLRHLHLFFERINKTPQQIREADVLDYLEYLKQTRKQQNSTRKIALIALSHYFDCLYKNGLLVHNPCRVNIRGTKVKKLHNMFTVKELEEFYEHFYHVFVRNYDAAQLKPHMRAKAVLCRQRNAAILSLLVY